jgi:catechol 2,3-dioxygenase-like lactoylglutathione lyase family enzyme
MNETLNPSALIARCSHLVIVSSDVPRITHFVSSFFGITPHFSNDQFSDFVLPGGFRIAFFVPTGATQNYFAADGVHHHVSIGVTSHNIDLLYTKALSEPFLSLGVSVSGPPKEHPWGERSFLPLDPDGNRWEVTESPSDDGMLVPR